MSGESAQPGAEHEALMTITERAQRYVPRRIRRTTRGFSLVVALLVVTYLVAEVWTHYHFVQGLVWVLAFCAYLVTLRALDTEPRLVYLSAAAIIVLAALAFVGLIVHQDALTAPAGIAVTLSAFVGPVLILRHVLRQRVITMDVIFGAIAVYVFLGIDFGVLFDLIAGFDERAFSTIATGDASLFYFSFMTLTTVGYGDIVPVSDWAQALTVVEALAGQVLLVALVARLVGMQIAQGLSSRSDGASASAAPPPGLDGPAGVPARDDLSR